MTQHIKPKNLIGVLLEAPKVHRSEGKVPFAYFRLSVKQTQLSDGSWKTVSTAYTQLVSVYGNLVPCVDNLKIGDRLHIEGRVKDQIWTDDNGMHRQSAQFVLRGIRVIVPEKIPAVA